MKIALVTYDDQGKYASSVENEDIRLLHYLQAKGLDIRPEIWTDATVNWQSYDLAILKSPWDYFDKIQQFYHWLSHLEKLQVPLLNPAPVVKWNGDKHYLTDIADKGLRVTPTLYLEQGQMPELDQYFDVFHTEKIIVKPCISGGSKNTFAITRADIARTTSLLQPLLEQETFMAQPFLPQIQETGEWSFIFFNGQFSHSLLKKAKPGDFRVQHYLGGTIHAGPAPAQLLSEATAYVEAFAKDCLYARVDGLEVNKHFLLMELELIEPFLFLFTHPDSYKNYYQALRRML
jgi:glutathione synthase/RimK-type ligase-like ATP-grasp enzyme